MWKPIFAWKPCRTGCRLDLSCSCFCQLYAKWNILCLWYPIFVETQNDKCHRLYLSWLQIDWVIIKSRISLLFPVALLVFSFIPGLEVSVRPSGQLTQEWQCKILAFFLEWAAEWGEQLGWDVIKCTLKHIMGEDNRLCKMKFKPAITVPKAHVLTFL